METQTKDPQLPRKKTPGRLVFGLLSLVSCGLCIGLLFAANRLSPALFSGAGSNGQNIFSDSLTRLLRAIGLGTGQPLIHVETGSYKSQRYTAPDGNFSCDFSLALNNNLNADLYSGKQNGDSYVYTTDDFGQKYAVDSLNPDFVGRNSFARLLDPATHTAQLDNFLKTVVLRAELNHSPDSKITHQEFVSDDILFAVLTVPHGSDLISSTSGNVTSINRSSGDASTTERMDVQKAYYIFAKTNWVYLVYFVYTPSPVWNPALEPSALQTRLQEFYQGCEFKP